MRIECVILGLRECKQNKPLYAEGHRSRKACNHVCRADWPKLTCEQLRGCSAAAANLLFCPKSWAPTLLPTYSSHPTTPATVTSHASRFFCKFAKSSPGGSTVCYILSPFLASQLASLFHRPENVLPRVEPGNAVAAGAAPEDVLHVPLHGVGQDGLGRPIWWVERDDNLLFVHQSIHLAC